jgi:thiamine-phosphate pyrophosphorylase
MLIIISPPKVLENEASLINQLFDSGMQLFHLRKPHATKEEVRLLLNEINPEYRKGVVLNQFYELSEEFGMNRFHFS